VQTIRTRSTNFKKKYFFKKSAQDMESENSCNLESFLSSKESEFEKAQKSFDKSIMR
jgi:hypothetical protein